LNEHPKSFADLGLREEILAAIAEAGYTEPTPIQAQAIPRILERRDVVGVAQTGTGKTASFTLPMLQILAAGRTRARMPRSLILSPTRELATQTARNFETYGKNLKLSMALLIGGVGMGDQERVLEKGVDVLIATPGRLLDWFERGKVLLGGVEILVIDEADRMLDMGFIPDVERIVSLLLRRQQTLLFSATMPKEVRRLADKFLRDPVTIEVAAPARKAELVEDVFVPADLRHKRDALLRLIETQNVGTAMIFCNTKREVSGLSRYLARRGLNARDIHGDLDQSVRQTTLDAFRRGEVTYLVATDVAARGLDITDMPVVINFDVPHTPDDYVHRIGRTGRAGRKGRAFTLITTADGRAVAAIERQTGRSIPRLEILPMTAEPAGDETEVRAPRSPRRRPARRTEAPRGEAVGAEPAADAPVVAEASAAQTPRAESTRGERVPRAARGRGAGSRKRAPARSEKPAEPPVVAFGDHVPRFLLQPAPVRVATKSGAE